MDWIRYTSIERYADKYNIAVVMPEVDGSCFYADMKHGYNYFTYLTEEVVAVAEGLLPVNKEPEKRLVAGLSMGVDGGIGSTYNFMADKFVQIQSLFRENRIPEAQAVQKEVNRIISVLCGVGVMQAEKELLNQLGFDYGCCRRPFRPLEDEAKELLRREVLPYIAEVTV